MTCYIEDIISKFSRGQVKITERPVPGYEKVLCAEDIASGYRGVIAIHSTVLGPAVGGTRFWSYPNDEEAIQDALRLSRGMTYKNALAGLPWGGGKSIIIGDNKTSDREKLFRAHGRFVDSLGGKYITAEDVGTSPSDMEFVRKETPHAAGLQGTSGDPSPHTARGVFRAMQAAARFRWASDDLSARTVAIQGCGHVGQFLAGELHRAGAQMVVTDVDSERAKRVASENNAKVVSPDDIYSVKADIFAPCALGGIINDQTSPRLQVEIITGGANNQLLEPHHGDLLEKRGILYAPDYAVNAGGVINGYCIEMLGWDRQRTTQRVDAIYDTLLEIFEIAAREKIPTYQAADRMAEAVIRQKQSLTADQR